ncbi:hypothetical protein OOK41_16295 [Micromonospora sp. NBC_01655]|uniref:hypothetical protein n=1 Tax=Micromonospora sp. NBC_01655 TaxID=2975983 RepID=UPI00224E759C|nr:hypothetical protein [Micromonospora sp. NBC_01655]MCX4471850.1 hypothetical protein [Micromonospora sp. NBC_01655]
MTTGHTAAALPAETGLPGRAVTATMALPDGTPSPHGYGCLQQSRVVQCVAVWTRSKENTAACFEKAIIATGEGLRA